MTRNKSSPPPVEAVTMPPKHAQVFLVLCERSAVWSTCSRAWDPLASPCEIKPMSTLSLALPSPRFFLPCFQNKRVFLPNLDSSSEIEHVLRPPYEAMLKPTTGPYQQTAVQVLVPVHGNYIQQNFIKNWKTSVLYTVYTAAVSMAWWQQGRTIASDKNKSSYQCIENEKLEDWNLNRCKNVNGRYVCLLIGWNTPQRRKNVKNVSCDIPGKGFLWHDGSMVVNLCC